jgi:exonuclease VII small subunit
VPRRLLGPGATEGTEEPSTPSAPQEAGCEGSGCGDAAAPASGTTNSEEFWRQRAAALREAVTAAEARLKQAEEKVAALRLGQSQPLPSDALRQLPPNPLLAPPDAEALAQELEKAKADLAQAQQALQGLDEEARKAGVPPGWIR